MGIHTGHHVELQLSPLKVGPSLHPAQRDVAMINSAALDALKKHAKLNGYGGSDDEDFCVALKTIGEKQRVRWKARDRKREKSLILRCKVTEAVKSSDDAARIQLSPALMISLGISPSPSSSILISARRHRPLPFHTVVLQASSSEVVTNEEIFDSLCAYPPPIIRQGLMWTRDDGEDFKVLMTAPVMQGFVERERTKLIVVPASVTSPADGKKLEEYLSESGTKATRLTTLDDFDATAFLTAALDIDLHDRFSGENDLPTINGQDETEFASLSASSGSITPRPARSSPVADGERWVAEHVTNGGAIKGDVDNESVVGVEGIRFDAVALQVPSDPRNRLREPRKMDKVDLDVDGFLPDEEAMCWLSVSDLARSGIFADDWVLLRSVHDSAGGRARLVQVKVDETIDDLFEESELPEHPVLLPPMLLHNLFQGRIESQSTLGVILTPIPSGHRLPSFPSASSLKLARLASAISTDKKYETVFNKALREYFEDSSGKRRRLMRNGDMIAVAVSELIGAYAELEEEENWLDGGNETTSRPAHLVYFVVTSLDFEPLKPLEEDFGSSVSSTARAGELGCWVNPERVKMLSTGLKNSVGMSGSKGYWDIPKLSLPVDEKHAGRVCSLMRLMTSPVASSFAIQTSLLITGAPGSGKTSLIRSTADETGLNIVMADCFELLADTEVKTLGAFEAVVAKAKECSPCVLLLKHVEAFGRKANAQEQGSEPGLSSRLSRLPAELQEAAVESGWPVLLVGMTEEEEGLPEGTMNAFKQTIHINAPNEIQRDKILREKLLDAELAPDVDVRAIARQTAALQAGDLGALVARAAEATLEDVIAVQPNDSPLETMQRAIEAGLTLSDAHLDVALQAARSSFSDSIGAPKIPNVSWDDVGGLANVKADILDTVQLPLQRPELFADGLRKRSGILLYGPPGTGKTLLAKAVATSCSLNFFSVKGPELLNMYIGESEANVRRVFQRARDAQPCVIFMDELDSIAPKRGNQGDSGGVMDRIVSQLLAELDGMSDGKGGDGVFVMAATNRPDLLDPALLRPGRFDRMLYLSVATEHETQLKIMQALTRKFKMHPELDLAAVANACPLHLTGADFYALCSDALLKAMSRAAAAVDQKIAIINKDPSRVEHLMTPQYYLATLAKPEELEVLVGQEDFERALSELVPSVSASEMEHYASVQRQFSAETINSKEKVMANGSMPQEQLQETLPPKKDKGKGKAL